MVWYPGLTQEQYKISSNPSHPKFDEVLNKVKEDIISSKSAYNAYQFCDDYCNRYKVQIDIVPFQNLIIESMEAGYIYKFALYIPGANRKLLEKAILNARVSCTNRAYETEWIAMFACNIPGINVKKFEDRIAKNKHAKSACILLKKFKNEIDVHRFKDTIIKSKKSRYLLELAKHLPPEERSEIEDLIIANKSDMYVRLYAERIKTADIKKLEKRIIKTRDREQITKFGKRVKGSTCKRFTPLF